jgi:hypothetical protein
MNYKKPRKIKISNEQKVDFLDMLDVALSDIARTNYNSPKICDDHPQYENVLDLNDIHREIQGVDYLIKLLQKLKVERSKEADKLLKKLS